MAGLLHAGLVAAALFLFGQNRPPPDPPAIELVLMPAPQPAQQPAAQPRPQSDPAPPSSPAARPAAEPPPPPAPEPEPQPAQQPAWRPMQHKPPPLKPPPPQPAPPRSVPPVAAPAMTAPVPAMPAAPTPTAPASAPAAAAPAPAAPAAENYGAILHAWLQRFRNYPEGARLRRQEGTVQVALTLDGSGRLLQARLYASSGFDLLDRAALAMAERAAPYPPPQFPAGTARTTYIVPVRYGLE
jgi:protein TonB